MRKGRYVVTISTLNGEIRAVHDNVTASNQHSIDLARARAAIGLRLGERIDVVTLEFVEPGELVEGTTALSLQPCVGVVMRNHLEKDGTYVVRTILKGTRPADLVFRGQTVRRVFRVIEVNREVRCEICKGVVVRAPVFGETQRFYPSRGGQPPNAIELLNPKKLVLLGRCANGHATRVVLGRDGSLGIDAAWTSDARRMLEILEIA